MKISYSKLVDRYIVSDQGIIQSTHVSLDDAMRVAGIEPEKEPGNTPSSDDEYSEEDLLSLFE
jgi:hypothetical protein